MIRLRHMFRSTGHGISRLGPDFLIKYLNAESSFQISRIMSWHVHDSTEIASLYVARPRNLTPPHIASHHITPCRMVSCCAARSAEASMVWNSVKSTSGASAMLQTWRQAGVWMQRDGRHGRALRARLSYKQHARAALNRQWGGGFLPAMCVHPRPFRYLLGPCGNLCITHNLRSML